MSDQVTEHFFLYTSHFQDFSRGHDLFQVDTGTFALPSPKINKSKLKEITIDLENNLKKLHPEFNVENYHIISLSYLGEMTREEFEL